MDEQKLKFYSLAKYPTFEVLMDSQLSSSGANQARLLEKYAKNKNYIKTQFYTLKFVFTFLFIFLPFISLIVYFEIVNDGAIFSNPVETILFIFSFIFGMLFLNLVLYVFLLGMFNVSSFMTGNSFKWLQTLPLSKKNLKKLGFMTLFRNLDVPLISMVLAFPVIMLILTKDFSVFLACLGPSVINTLFSFSLLVIVSEKISHIFYESSGRSKKKHILRVVIMLIFFVSSFGTSFLIQWSFTIIEDLIAIFPVNEFSLTLNLILSIVPYPLAPGYLVAIFLTPGQIPFQVILTTIIGIALFILLSIALYKIAIKHLRITVSSEFEISKTEEKKEVRLEDIKVEIKAKSTIASYIHKDLVSSTRDIQTFMFLIMPIIYPVILILSMQAPIIYEVGSPLSVMILWSIILFMDMFLPIILVIGLLNIEESGSSIVASLPIIPRDQAKAKILLMATIQGISLTLMAIVLTILTKSLDVLLIFISSIPISLSLLLFMFELKIRLFGRMKYKYIIEELNKENKVMKWIAILTSQFAVFFFTLIIGYTMFFTYGLFIASIVLIVMGTIELLMFIFILTRMFPKVEKIPTYQTRGLLRNIPILGALFLTVLYTGFQFLALFGEILFFIPFGFLLNLTNYTTLLFIEFLFQFGFLAILWLLVVPKGLKLPELSYSFTDYSKKIHLTTNKPVLRNIALGIGSFIILSAIVFLAANIFGTYIFDLSILFGNPNPFLPGLASLGWFIWIFMLIPGIWEEITHRGVVIPMLLKKHRVRTALIISSVIFGFAHTFNVISLTLMGVDPIIILISVSLQVIYATILGFAFGYMYIKTKSLLPSMILHYLVDSAGQLFLNTYIDNIILVGVFLIVFFALIPTILIGLLVKFVTESDRTQNIFNDK